MFLDLVTCKFTGFSIAPVAWQWHVIAYGHWGWQWFSNPCRWRKLIKITENLWTASCGEVYILFWLAVVYLISMTLKWMYLCILLYTWVGQKIMLKGIGWGSIFGVLMQYFDLFIGWSVHSHATCVYKNLPLVWLNFNQILVLYSCYWKTVLLFEYQIWTPKLTSILLVNAVQTCD